MIYTYSKKLINSTSDSRLRPHNYSDSFVRDKLNPIVKSVFGDDTEDYYTSDSDDLVACVFDQSVINLKDKVDILITKSPIDYTTVYMIQLPVDTYAEDFDEFENKVIQYSGAIEEFNKYECSMLNNSYYFHNGLMLIRIDKGNKNNVSITIKLPLEVSSNVSQQIAGGSAIKLDISK